MVPDKRGSELTLRMASVRVRNSMALKGCKSFIQAELFGVPFDPWTPYTKYDNSPMDRRCGIWPSTDPSNHSIRETQAEGLKQ
jgi:hypothetical protein